MTSRRKDEQTLVSAAQSCSESIPSGPLSALSSSRWRLRRSLRVLDRLPHPARRRRHVDAIDAERTERINDRIDDDRRSADGAGFADALHADRIGLAFNFFQRDL